LHAIMNAPLEAPSKRRPELPPAFDALVMRALERHPGDRFSCAEEMGDALLAFAAPQVRARWAAEFHPPSTQSDTHGESVAPVTSSRSIPVARPVRSMRLGVLGVALFAALALASIGTRSRFGVSQAGATVPAVQSPAAAPGSASAPAPAPAPASASASASAPPPVPAPAPSPAHPHAPPPARPAPSSSAPSEPSSRPPATIPTDNGAPILDPR